MMMDEKTLRARDWGWLVLVLAILFVPGVLLRDFWITPEGRRALIALEMLRRGEWLAPHLQGKPFLSKPPLFYWLTTAAFKLTGSPSDWASRLPSLLAAIAGVLAFVRLMASLLGRPSAILAGLLLAASPVYCWMGQTAEPEMIFAAACLVAMGCFSRILELDRPSWPWEAGFYGALGVSMMAKGPLDPVMPLLTLLVWLPLRRRGRRLLHIPPALGVLVIFLPLLAWLGAVALSGYSLAPLFKQAMSHAAEKTEKSKPVLFYFKELRKILFPWGIIVLGALAATGAAALSRRGRGALRAYFGQDRGERLLLALWFAISLLVLTAISTKKFYYGMALAGPAAGVCALLYHDWAGRPQERLGGWLRRHGGWVTGGLAVLAAVLLAAAWQKSWPKMWRVFDGEELPDKKVLLGWAGAWCLGLALAARVAVRRGRAALLPRTAAHWTVASLLALAMVYNLGIHRVMDKSSSYERAMREMQEKIPAGAPVVTVKGNYTACFYLGRFDLPILERLKDFKTYLGQHPEAVALVGGNKEKEIERLGGLEIRYASEFIRDKAKRILLVGRGRSVRTAGSEQAEPRAAQGS